MPTLALINTVSWYQLSVIEPFANPWLQANPGVRLINITDDSLLTDALAHGGPTESVVERFGLYVNGAENAGADVVMSTCTSMGLAMERARTHCRVPLFNIDEPMAAQAVRHGPRLGVLATVPTS